MKKIRIGQIKMGSLISYLSIAVGIITGVLYTPWMVRQIGQANYGLYTLATSLISMFMLDFGLSSAVSRFVAKYRAEGNQQGVSNILGIVYKLYFLIDLIIVVVLIVLYFFLGNIYGSLTPEELEQFKVLYLMVAAFNIVAFPCTPISGVLSAYEKFTQLKLCDLFHKLFTVLLVVVALTVSDGVIWVVGANILSGLTTILLKYLIMSRSVSLRINYKAKGKDLYKQLFSFTVWTTIITLMQRLGNNIAPTVLGITSGSNEIAVFAPAVTLDGYFYMIGAAVGGMFLPRVSRFLAENRMDKVLDLMIKVGRYQIVVLGWVYIGFVCVGYDFVSLWMGPEYSKSYWCALLIIFPLIISSSLEIGNMTMIAKNILQYQAIGMIFSTVLGLVLSWVLSFRYGAIGVSVGLCLSALIRAGYLSWVCHHKGGINVNEFIKTTYIRAVPLYAITVLAGLLLGNVIPISGWIGVAVKALAITAVFAVTVIAVYLTPEEKSAFLNNVIKRSK